MADESELLSATAEIVAAYLGGGARIEVGEIPDLIRSIRSTLAEDTSKPAETVVEADKPTNAQIRKSITPDALVSFIDGKRYKTLKRHLSTNGLTIDGYKERYGLPKDYPTTAPAYSAQRSEMAKRLGLGNKGRGGGAAAKAAPAKGRKAKPSA